MTAATCVEPQVQAIYTGYGSAGHTEVSGMRAGWESAFGPVEVRNSRIRLVIAS